MQVLLQLLIVLLPLGSLSAVVVYVVLYPPMAPLRFRAATGLAPGVAPPPAPSLLLATVPLRPAPLPHRRARYDG